MGGTAVQAFYEIKSEEVLCQYREQLEFPKHLHRQVEMAVVLSGSTRAWAEGRGGELRQGQAFIAFPNQVHHYLEDSPDMKCLLFIFSPELLPALAPVFAKKTPVSPVIPLDLPALMPVLTLLEEEARHPRPYSQAVLEGGLTLLLASLFRRTDFEESDLRHVNATRLILDYCNAHYAEPITLAEVAAGTHMSKYYVSRLFRQEVGMSFPAYISALRIHDARDLLLEEAASVTEVAYRVGFNSLRSFNRQFLAATGLTPGEYRRRGERV